MDAEREKKSPDENVAYFFPTTLSLKSSHVRACGPIDNPKRDSCSQDASASVV